MPVANLWKIAIKVRPTDISRWDALDWQRAVERARAGATRVPAELDWTKPAKSQ